jgi:hypothetical protein
LLLVTQIAVLVFLNRIVKNQDSFYRKEAVSGQKSAPAQSAKIERKTERGGMVICPKCYSAIDMHSVECPVCRNVMR